MRETRIVQPDSCNPIYVYMGGAAPEFNPVYFWINKHWINWTACYVWAIFGKMEYGYTSLIVGTSNESRELEQLVWDDPLNCKGHKKQTRRPITKAVRNEGWKQTAVLLAQKNCRMWHWTQNSAFLETELSFERGGGAHSIHVLLVYSHPSSPSSLSLPAYPIPSSAGNEEVGCREGGAREGDGSDDRTTKVSATANIRKDGNQKAGGRDLAQTVCKRYGQADRIGNCYRAVATKASKTLKKSFCSNGTKNVPQSWWTIPGRHFIRC